MSVFKRPGETTYSYRFQSRGRGFSGQTGLTSKREAQIFEQREKAKAEAGAIDPKAQLTFNAAASRYWLEHGQHKSNPKDTFRQIGWLEKRIGANTLITDIDNSLVASLMAQRRGEIVRGKPLSHGAVNRSVHNVLRRILGRADKVWGKPVPSINWAAHKLPEPRERVREATPAEMEELFKAIRYDYAPALAFAFLTGCRLAEIVGLRWQHIDWFNREFTVVAKGNNKHTVPMSQAVHALLWELKDHHTEAVFTYVAKAARDGRARGKRYPVTYNGLKTQWRRCRAKTNVIDFRFHDTRHTAATRLLRATGNLRLAQSLLGHSDISTTTKYAHVTKEDLRDALDTVHGTPGEAKNCTENGTKPLSVALSHGNNRRTAEE